MNFDAWTIVGLVLSVAALVGGGVYLFKVKTKLAQALDLLNKAVIYGKAVLAAAEDHTFDPAEKADLKVKWDELVVAIKLFINKAVVVE